jgi:hypothetical protein
VRIARLDMEILKSFVNSWFGQFVLANSSGMLLLLLYSQFHLIIFILGNIVVQLIWFLLFISLSVRGIIKSKLLVLPNKVVLIILFVIISWFIQLFNLTGALSITVHQPKQVSICHNQVVYERTGGDLDVNRYFTSPSPILGYKEVFTVSQFYGESFDLKFKEFCK